MKLKMKDMPMSFVFLFSIIEIQNEEVDFLMEDNQKLRDEINLLKVESTQS